MKILTTFTLITLLLFNSSCEKDLYDDAVYKPETSIIKYGIHENQLKSEPVFNDVKNQFTSIVNSNNSKSNNTPFFDLEQDLINRLDLEKTHLNSIGNKQVLNAPIKTFGSYKRALLALKNNQHTSAYIITYPNPENDAVFYVANLQGKLLQKVTIQPNGIGLVEYFNDSNNNTSNKESQNTTYNSGCTETVYVTCSQGIHSFDLGNAHECYYWNNLSQGTPPRMFSIACSDGGGSGGNDNYDPNDNPFDTGNGNPNDNPYDGSDNNSFGGGFSTVPSQNGSNPDGISNCITNIDCPDCNLQNDINNDCNLDANEIMFNAFYNNSLNNMQQLFLDINTPTKNNIFNYLRNENWSDESETFVIELLDLAIENNATFNFDNTIDPANSLNFDNVSDFQDYLDNIPTDGFDFEVEDDLQTNQKIAKCKFPNGLYSSISVSIKQKMSPYQVLNINSNITGMTLFDGWEQTNYTINILDNSVRIDLYGIKSSKIFLEGIGTFFEYEVHYVILIDKTNGQIYASYQIP